MAVGRPEEVGALPGAQAHDPDRSWRQLVEGSTDQSDDDLQPAVQRRARLLVGVVPVEVVAGVTHRVAILASRSRTLPKRR